MTRTRTTLASLAFAAACASQLGATDCGQILSDSGFDLWCGDRLCNWKLERGEIEQVATWREGDDGVSMIGGDVAISQRTAVNSTDTDCIRFDMVANIDETAEVFLQADVFGDGTVDWEERIPTSSWDAVSMRIGIDGYYDGILFRLTKTGSGDAVLAQIKAEVVEDGDGGCPSYLDPVPLPLGATCGFEACGEGTCFDGVCSACLDDAGCDAGEVCGRADDVPGLLSAWYTCVPTASRELGETCFRNEECASGACYADVCGECLSTSMCDGGAACIVADADVAIGICESGPRAAGEPCVTDAMCASGTCDGTPLGWCDFPYGGPTVPCFADDQCPAPSDFTSGTCTFVAVAGGSCQ